ncbi:MAG: hypothetical protein Q3999_02545, partial [Buchananella hordeovulneris]|nr:hypothetical protein [Buchananella hordeovulneris]
TPTKTPEPKQPQHPNRMAFLVAGKADQSLGLNLEEVAAFRAFALSATENNLHAPNPPSSNRFRVT